jgi:hypothetical protein
LLALLDEPAEKILARSAARTDQQRDLIVPLGQLRVRLVQLFPSELLAPRRALGSIRECSEVAYQPLAAPMC